MIVVSCSRAVRDLLASKTCDMRRSNPHRSPHRISCNGARAQGSKEGWDPSIRRRLSASQHNGHTSNLGISNVPFVSLSFRRSSFHFQNGTFRHQTCLEIAPERNQQLARDGNDRNPSDAALEVANTITEPDTQEAVRLIPQPQPRELNHRRAGLGVTSLTDTLITRHRAALKMRRRQTDVAPQLFAIVK